MKKAALALLSIIAAIGVASPAVACATCGLSNSYTPVMFLISTGFVVLPVVFASFIAWRVYKDQQSQKNTSDTEPKTKT